MIRHFRSMMSMLSPTEPIDLPAGDGLSLLGVTKTSNGTRVISQANHEHVGLVAFEKMRRAGIAAANYRHFA